MPIKNGGLRKAKREKNDEFYTQYSDIEDEINAYLKYNPDTFKNKTILCPCNDPEYSNFTKHFIDNFNKLKLKQLITTSYISKNNQHEITDYEKNSPNFDINKEYTHGKIFTLTNKNNNKNLTINDLQWEYLDGNGDFRSEEITKLRKKSDVIITNSPFSMFREFLSWIMEGNKQFLIMGNVNCITYKEVFSLIKDNKIWLGNRMNRRVNGKNMVFQVPDNYPMSGTETFIGTDGKKYTSVAIAGWYTNLDLGKRHQPLELKTMEENIQSKKYKKLNQYGYRKYDNYNALEVPYTKAIPSDYNGIMGVPISFLNWYCPEQFEILGDSRYHDGETKADDINYIDGKLLYRRILIQKGDSPKLD